MKLHNLIVSSKSKALQSGLLRPLWSENIIVAGVHRKLGLETTIPITLHISVTVEGGREAEIGGRQTEVKIKSDIFNNICFRDVG